MTQSLNTFIMQTLSSIYWKEKKNRHATSETNDRGGIKIDLIIQKIKIEHN